VNTEHFLNKNHHYFPLLVTIFTTTSDLREMQVMNWRTRIEDKLAWKKIVEQAKTHPGL
jgi:CRISPR/Cas system-associated endonuclease Cas1